ncbi:hypothetical protein ASPZODRAFT_144886 [Penicilliopsis zonata CBS 506.65]|uniref:BTB domain-containing protein n=1 Tax=Penicilliopsis zonata CBS 506.65 TaxID=1073090 RepID=A0A1L9SAU8_9EURO|nr:hypothetical protein ASPZODRAFT_144886 [Penicilliopsis zonata CBS 506.65]OJJ44312.1 hypothetical protein ASPZODRAFT_144886 [Penicilliopsis zonata CBS 506.65]
MTVVVDRCQLRESISDSQGAKPSLLEPDWGGREENHRSFGDPEASRTRTCFQFGSVTIFSSFPRDKSVHSLTAAGQGPCRQFLLSFCFLRHMHLLACVSDVMFKRSFASKDRAGKTVRATKKTYGKQAKVKMQEKLESPPRESPLTSPIITLVVGHEQRLFAAHEDVLCRSPFFNMALEEDRSVDESAKRVVLPDDYFMVVKLNPHREPEILSCVLEFLYKGDYYPRLLHGKHRDSWRLEGAQDIHGTGGRGSSEATFFHSGVGDFVLRDTVVYCSAEKYGLEDLKRLALRKQGLQRGIPVDVILRSARYAYDHTPDSDSRLRAHYLALIIRSRKAFKKSGSMQMEMEAGGKFFFDLFVAMCNHMEDLTEVR